MRVSISICILLLALIYLSEGLYSHHYHKCRLRQQSVDPNAIALEQLQHEKVLIYPGDYDFTPTILPQKQLDFQKFTYFYHEKIGEGLSGQVYLVQKRQKLEGRIAKRYFQESGINLRRENYIMNKLKDKIQWAKDCGDKDCDDDANNFTTLSLYPYKISIVLQKLPYGKEQTPLFFYKSLRQLDRSHQNGIIHNDIKMGNILIHALDQKFKFYDVQLIDWNFATFYYRGFHSTIHKGTPCYFSPEQELGLSFPTPAVDVWAMGVALFTYMNSKRPFLVDCQKNNLEAIVSLVGGKKILQIYEKYRFNSLLPLKIINDIRKNPQKYPPANLASLFNLERDILIDKNLLNLFGMMLEVDPEKRGTARQLMKMDYFKKIKSLPEMYYHKNKKKKERMERKKLKEKTASQLNNGRK